MHLMREDIADEILISPEHCLSSIDSELVAATECIRGGIRGIGPAGACVTVARAIQRRLALVESSEARSTLGCEAEPTRQRLRQRQRKGQSQSVRHLAGRKGHC